MGSAQCTTKNLYCLHGPVCSRIHRAASQREVLERSLSRAGNDKSSQCFVTADVPVSEMFLFSSLGTYVRSRLSGPQRRQEHTPGRVCHKWAWARGGNAASVQQEGKIPHCVSHKLTVTLQLFDGQFHGNWANVSPSGKRGALNSAVPYNRRAREKRYALLSINFALWSVQHCELCP